jgi:hypothetical protein
MSKDIDRDRTLREYALLTLTQLLESDRLKSWEQFAVEDAIHFIESGEWG